MKRFACSIGILLLLLYLFCYPLQALAASKSGLDLWLHTLLPTLLPFMLLSNLLIGTGMTEKLMKPLQPFFRILLDLGPFGSYAFLLGMLCGYPMGAKLTSDLYRTQKLSRGEATYLLTFCNNASPMFISTYLVHTILKKPDLLAPTFGILYLSNFLCSLCFRLYKKTPEADLSIASWEEVQKPSSSDAWIDASIMNGFETITRLGGYILLFSILAAALETFWPGASPGKYFLLTMTEISTGLHQLNASGLRFPTVYLAAMAGTSFGGLCILAQTRSVIRESGLPLTPYIAGKTLNLFFTVLLTTGAQRFLF